MRRLGQKELMTKMKEKITEISRLEEKVVFLSLGISPVLLSSCGLS